MFAAPANERERLSLDADVKVLGNIFLGHKIARGKSLGVEA